MTTFSVLHRYNSGDLIAAMAGMRQVWEDTGNKAVIYQQLDYPAFYYEGANHPVKSSSGQQVSMNQAQFDLLIPLLKAQPYIEGAKVWRGEACDIDLTNCRDSKAVPMPYGDLHWWVPMVVPQFATDFGRGWITCESPLERYKDSLIIANTGRYPNHNIHYWFLKNYDCKKYFLGVKDEWEQFESKWGLGTELIQCEDFLELANILAGCKLFIGNQCFIYNLAEAMKVPRILEYCPAAPHLHPKGENGYLAVYQEALEYYVEKHLSND